jgi:hypothetical protein
MRTYEKPVCFRDQLPSPLLGWQLSGTRDVERSREAQPGNTSREHHPRTMIQVLQSLLERKLNLHWSAMACRSTSAATAVRRLCPQHGILPVRWDY